jgi:transcriptional regulator with XRE-family HTH domain
VALAQLDTEALYQALDLTRRDRGLSWRQVAAEAGIGASTLSRMRRGKRPDVDAFASLVTWLGSSADGFLVSTPVERDDDLARLVGLLTGPGSLEDEYTDRESEHVDDIVYGPVPQPE